MGVVVDYMYLARMWNLSLSNWCCDICRDFRIEVPAIYCSKHKFRTLKKAEPLLTPPQYLIQLIF